MQPNQPPTQVPDAIKGMLNNTGIFLEGKVHAALQKKYFAVRREEPYQLITPSGELVGTIDVLAVCHTGAGFDLCLCIECKKANPEQKHWVFERGEPVDRNAQHPQDEYGFVFYDEAAKHANYSTTMPFRALGYTPKEPFERALQAFEFNEAKGSLSRNSEEKAYNAIQQANRALAGINPNSHPDRLLRILDTGETRSVLYLPVVVTTANLWVIDYLPDHVGWKDGTIDIKDLGALSKNWVHYAFPLPLSLQVDGGAAGTPNKRPTFIVNSQSFETFIEKLLLDCMASTHSRS